MEQIGKLLVELAKNKLGPQVTILLLHRNYSMAWKFN